MKKSNIIILVVLLVSTAVFFYLKNQDRSTNLEIKPDFFQVRDTQTVSKIFITDRNGNSATLERKSFYWTINQGFRCDRNNIDNLFEPLVKMRINAPVSDADAQEMIKEMTVAQMKVEIYRGDKLDRTLFIGNATADGMGTYIYAANQDLDRPYIVSIPGWNGNLSPRFFLKEMAWRSKKVFHISPIQIEYIQVEFANTDLISYKLENLDGTKASATALNGTGDTSRSINENRVKEVFMNSGKIYYEDYLLSTANNKIDSIYNLLPTYASIALKVKNKEEIKLILKEKPQAPIENVLEGAPQIDRFYAYFLKDENKTIGVLQRQMAAKLLKNFDRFENTK